MIGLTLEVIGSTLEVIGLTLARAISSRGSDGQAPKAAEALRLPLRLNPRALRVPVTPAV